MSNASNTSQVVFATPVEALANLRTSQVVALTVLDNTIAAPYTRTSQVVLTAPVVTDGVTRTSQQVTMVVYGEGSRENYKLRAWSFYLDGNWYYVLHLGLQGTWVYCLTSDTWAQWVTAGYDNWNAEQGLVWNARIVAGDNQNGILWEVDPETMVDDDFRPITRVVTAILPQAARKTTTVGGVWITASVGFPTAADPLVNLRFSDDYGNTWVDMDSCDVTLLPGEFGQEIAFRSLGTFGAPGRVFEVSDVGGAVRIDRAEIEMT